MRYNVCMSRTLYIVGRSRGPGASQNLKVHASSSIWIFEKKKKERDAATACQH